MPSYDQKPSKWEGRDSQGMGWRLTIEPDCFDLADGLVVSVAIDNDEGAGEDTGLAMLTPEEARQAAAALIASADYVALSLRTEGTP